MLFYAGVFMLDSKSLDRSKFFEELEVSSILLPCKLLGRIKQNAALKEAVLNIRHIPPVRSVTEQVRVECGLSEEESQKFRLVMLKPEIKSVEDLAQGVMNLLEDSVSQKLHRCALRREYDHMSSTEVLRQILPAGVDVPASFETVGHLAHFNLRPEQDPFKHLIGQVILDKNPGIKTVVNKSSKLKSTFRTPELELLAGEQKFEALVKEGGVTLSVDFSKVYWNSRLSTERQRVLERMFSSSPLSPCSTEVSKEKIVMVDMCAGVGGLAIMAAKRGAKVYANDLNPEAAEVMRKNAKRNKVEVDVSNLDGSSFVRDLEKQGVFQEERVRFHFLMNLPELAIEFLSVFSGLLRNRDGVAPHFVVHCHCFSKASPPLEDLRERVRVALEVEGEGGEGGETERSPKRARLENEEDNRSKKVSKHLGDQSRGRFFIHGQPVFVREVRDVAPKKKMYCVEFKVMEEVLRK